MAEPSNGPTRALDAIGIGLAIGTIAWAIVVSRAADGSAAPMVGILIATTVAIALARWLEDRVRCSVAFLVLVGAVGWFGAAWLESGRWGDPLGYTNASAALAVQAMIAGLILVVLASSIWIRVAGALGVVLFGATPFILDARTAAFLVIVTLLASGLGMALRWRRRGVVVAGMSLLLVLAATIGLAVSGSGRSGSVPDRIVDASLTEARLDLWRDAIDIVSDHPILGVGWGGFATTSPIARSDEDRRFAHNEFLQVGAEAGILGALLVVLIFTWGFIRIFVAPSPDAMAWLGAIALAAVGVSASVDYVLRFPAVGLAAALLVGGAQVGRVVTATGPRTLRSVGAELHASHTSG